MTENKTKKEYCYKPDRLLCATIHEESTGKGLTYSYKDLKRKKSLHGLKLDIHNGRKPKEIMCTLHVIFKRCDKKCFLVLF